jgi:hypothetical protein
MTEPLIRRPLCILCEASDTTPLSLRDISPEGAINRDPREFELIPGSLNWISDRPQRILGC